MKRKITYNNSAELASDLSFIEWIKSGSEASKKEWQSRIPEKQLEIWSKEARIIVGAFKFEDETISTALKMSIWNQIDSKTQEIDKQAKVVQFSYRRWAAVAASLLICVVAGWLIWPEPSETMVLVENGKTSNISLPDDSKVTINSDSRLEYVASSWKDTRQVKLEGEAYFEVEKGKTFTVRTDFGSVEVLGTSFNVVSRESEFEVKCYTGKVRVTSKDQSVVLLPGNIAILDKSNLVKNSFSIDTERIWTNGYFLFNNKPLKNVFAELERQFDVHVNDNQINSSATYNGFFTKGDLTKALEAICWPMRLDFTVNQKEVVIFNDQK